MTVSIAPPMNPSTVLFGLIQCRSGVRPTADPTNSAPTSLATTPSASRNKVSVPRCSATSSRLPELVEKRRISIANEPSRPIQTMPERRDRDVGHRAGFDAAGADEAAGRGHEPEREHERQRADTEPVGRERCGDAGDDARHDRGTVALLGDLVVELDGGEPEDHHDEAAATRPAGTCSAAMNAAASTSPTAIAAGMSRPDEREHGERPGCPRAAAHRGGAPTGG